MPLSEKELEDLYKYTEDDAIDLSEGNTFEDVRSIVCEVNEACTLWTVNDAEFSFHLRRPVTQIDFGKGADVSYLSDAFVGALYENGKCVVMKDALECTDQDDNGLDH